MADRRMARADLVTGGVLFVLSVAVIYGAWTMDRLELRHIHPLSAPGLLPGLLGVALAITSFILIVKAAGIVRGPPPAAEQGEQSEPSDADALKRLLFAAALCLVYALGLVGRMPFWLATTIFVTAFILAFEWDRSIAPARRLAVAGWALFLGFGTGLSVSYVFSDLFLVRLP